MITQRQIEDIFAELRVAHDADAFTTMEVAEAMGVGENTALRHIRALVKAGRLVPTRVTRQRIDGVMATVPAYREAP
jgi:predicted transcriptional regulator